MADALSKEAIERLLTYAANVAVSPTTRLGYQPQEMARAQTVVALLAERDRLTRENAALRDVAEKFRAWTDAKPHTVEESDALHEACESLGGYDAWKASAT